MNWQPIETAPKDGRKIFIYRHGWEEAPIAIWGEHPDNPVVSHDHKEVYMSGWISDSWAMHGLEEGFIGWDEDIEDRNMPTHWMPLPEPPE